MIAFDPAPFLAALQAVFRTTAAAVVTLPETDLIFMANYRCQPAERLHYPSYQEFLRHIDHGLVCPNLPNAEAYYEVYSLLRAEALEQQVKMLGAIEEGKPNWRRYCWLLERRDKQARLKKHNEAVRATKPKQPTQVLESPAMENVLQPLEVPHVPEPSITETGEVAPCLETVLEERKEQPLAETAALQPSEAQSTPNQRLSAKQRSLNQEKAKRRYGAWVPSTGRFAPKSHVPAEDSELGKKLSEIGRRYVPYW